MREGRRARICKWNCRKFNSWSPLHFACASAMMSWLYFERRSGPYLYSCSWLTGPAIVPLFFISAAQKPLSGLSELSIAASEEEMMMMKYGSEHGRQFR